MANHSQKPAESLDHTIMTRHRSQNTTQTSQAPSKQSVSSSDSGTHLLRTKKQRAKERGRQLQKLIQEKRARGELKKSDKPKRTKSQKAGIFFPVAKFHKKLKKHNPRCLVPTLSAVLISAVIEYLTAEVLELAGNVSSELKRQRIKPRDIFLAIKNDTELETLLKDTVLTQSGTLPGIHPSLLPKTSIKLRKNDTQSSTIDQSETSKSQKSETPTKRKHEDDQDEEEQVHEQAEVQTPVSTRKTSPAKRVKQ